MQNNLCTVRRRMMTIEQFRSQELSELYSPGRRRTDDPQGCAGKCRNLVLIFSIEGKEMQTNARRGEGIYEKVLSATDKM